LHPQESAPALLVFHPEARTGAEKQVIQEFLRALGAETRVAVFEDSALADLAGPEAGDDPRLQIYQAMRRAGAQGTWHLRFFRAQGVVQWEGFDNGQGVRAQRGAKLRSVAQDQLSEEHLERVRQTIAAVTQDLTGRAALVAGSREQPYTETLAWPLAEDPPHPGFRWAFEAAGPRVSYVYEGSSITAAGLQAGDLLVSANGQSVASPPRLGRTLGPLRAGEALALSVLRGERAVELAGQVESSAELIPRWQQAIIGKPVPGLEPDRATLLVAYSPSMPDTWECFATVRWIRDHYPAEQLAILGVASRTDETALRDFLQAKQPGWPSRPDASGQLSDALRVHRTPAFLLMDAHGTLRFVRADEAHLRQAIETVLGLKE